MTEAATRLKERVLELRKQAGDPSVVLEVRIAEYDARDLSMDAFYRFLQDCAEQCGMDLRTSFPDFSVLAHKLKDPHGLYAIQLQALRNTLGGGSATNIDEGGEGDGVTIRQAVSRAAMSDSEDSVIRELRVRLAGERHEQLARLYSNLAVMEALAIMQGTPQKFDYFKENRHEFSARHISRILKPHGVPLDQPTASAISTAVPIMERFYELAEERQEIFVRKTMDAMKELNERCTVMNFAGFNLPGVVRELNSRTISNTQLAVNDAK